MKAKKIISMLTLCLIISAGCKKEEQRPSTPEKSGDKKTVLPQPPDTKDSVEEEGDESQAYHKDEVQINRCTGSGYFWSSLKNDCVKVSTVGKRLWDGKHENAYIIFSEDKHQVELFYPGKTTSIILNQNDDAFNVYWKNGVYKLYYMFGSNLSNHPDFGLKVLGWDKYSTVGGFM